MVIQMIVQPKSMKTIPNKLEIMRALANLRVLKSFSLKLYSDGQVF
ncbi:unnamed protein product [Paramecium primaurelia]|uniref:Uncharacterized protein n=1 Tax=Paramecium primaurelia TaxID=5886 RepID=A0A8S1NTL7_PARPR|nr:unnamed protein product [Paramecium primaurelia]